MYLTYYISVVVKGVFVFAEFLIFLFEVDAVLMQRLLWVVGGVVVD
jgi:hypothetical protein